VKFTFVRLLRIIQRLFKELLMFRSHSLMALPVLLLPLYGAASALPGAATDPQQSATEVAYAQHSPPPNTPESPAVADAIATPPVETNEESPDR
jgi:hypothetical protein